MNFYYATLSTKIYIYMLLNCVPTMFCNKHTVFYKLFSGKMAYSCTAQREGWTDWQREGLVTCIIDVWFACASRWFYLTFCLSLVNVNLIPKVNEDTMFSKIYFI